jgi:C-terminal processing protease CtpA/Prc
LALQTAGKAAIVLDGPHRHDAAIPQVPVPLPFGLFAVLRTHELQHSDSSIGFTPNLEVNEGGLDAALAMARSGKIEPVRRTGPWTPRTFAEKAYPEMRYPDEGYRLLAAARVWSVFEYFFPYKHLIGEDWDKVLPAALADARSATDAVAYHKAIARLVARTNDTHCFVSSPVLSEVFGTASVPMRVRWIEDRPVVTQVLKEAASAGVLRGDVVTAIDGRPVQERMETVKPLIAASTPQSLHSRLTASLLNGADGSLVKVTLEGPGGVLREVSLIRSARHFKEMQYDRAGPVYRKITDKFGYVDLPRLDPGDVDAMFTAFRDTEAIILDMRGYPRGTAWQIAPRLSPRFSPVNAQFRRNTLSGTETGSWYFEQKLPFRRGDLYTGRTVLLIDERAISQSEHSGLMYRTANGMKFIGTPTQGANGDVTFFFAPGNIRISFSGHDVRWPDGTQLQRVGLQPDIPVAPTIQGIRDGRDEILEKAIEHLKSQ